MLLERLPKVKGRYIEHADLSRLCWFGIGGKAEILYIPPNLDDLELFLQNKPYDIPIFILGVGSNLLFRSGIIEGVIIKLGSGFGNISLISSDTMVVGAAALDADVAVFAMKNSIGGFEFLSGIPGTIGGAIKMNAGAYGSSISDIIINVKAINYDGSITTFDLEDMNYNYRGNNIGEDWIFAEATFRGQLQEQINIVNIIDDIQSKRQKNQPIRARTAGCTFKNPNSNRAWKLISEAGCCGLKVGDVQVSNIHANFFINNGNGTAEDVMELIKIVKKRVKEKFDVELEEELIIV